MYYWKKPLLKKCKHRAFKFGKERNERLKSGGQGAREAVVCNDQINININNYVLIK